MPAYAFFNRTHKKTTKLIYTLAAFVSHSHVHFTIRFSLTEVSSLNKHLLVIRQYIYECGTINVLDIHSYVKTILIYNINVRVLQERYAGYGIK